MYFYIRLIGKTLKWKSNPFCAYFRHIIFCERQGVFVFISCLNAYGFLPYLIDTIAVDIDKFCS